MSIKDRVICVFGPLRLVWVSIKCRISFLTARVRRPADVPGKVHYEAFKEALHKDGLASLQHPQKIRDVAITRLFSITCTYPPISPISLF
jgi:hypothetical protein